jgi:hypothetical protein
VLRIKGLGVETLAGLADLTKLNNLTLTLSDNMAASAWHIVAGLTKLTRCLHCVCVHARLCVHACVCTVPAVCLCFAHGCFSIAVWLYALGGRHWKAHCCVCACFFFLHLGVCMCVHVRAYICVVFVMHVGALALLFCMCVCICACACACLCLACAC